MTPCDPLSLDLLWDAILSRDPDKIVHAYGKLKPDEKDGILEHLERMTTEEGWHVEQVQSAQAALNAIRQNPVDDCCGPG